MATDWGKTVGSIKLSDSTELKVNADAEMDGKRFLVLSKWVKTAKYSGPVQNGTTLIPAEKVLKVESNSGQISLVLKAD